MTATGLTTWRGENRSGVAGTGCADESPFVIMQKLFCAGWRWAIAERDGFEVGGIGPHPDTGKRDFWGEL